MALEGDCRKACGTRVEGAEAELERFFRETEGIRDPALAAKLLAMAELREYQLGDVPLEQGAVPQNLYFLYSGSVRGYFLNEYGREVTDVFMVRRGEAVMPFEYRKPCCVSFEVLQPTRLVVLPLEDALAVLTAHAEGRAAYKRIVEHALHSTMAAKFQMHNPAIARYEWFCRTYPMLLGVVTDKTIASYLGVTPVTVSRLRGRMRTRTDVDLQRGMW